MRRKPLLKTLLRNKRILPREARQLVLAAFSSNSAARSPPASATPHLASSMASCAAQSKFHPSDRSSPPVIVEKPSYILPLPHHPALALRSTPTSLSTLSEQRRTKACASKANKGQHKNSQTPPLPHHDFLDTHRSRSPLLWKRNRR